MRMEELFLYETKVFVPTKRTKVYTFFFYILLSLNYYTGINIDPIIIIL